MRALGYSTQHRALQQNRELVTSTTQQPRRGRSRKENPRDHDYRLRSQGNDAAARRPYASRVLGEFPVSAAHRCFDHCIALAGPAESQPVHVADRRIFTPVRLKEPIVLGGCARGLRRPPAEGSADSGRPRPLRGLCECLSAASDRLAPLPPMRTLTHLVAAQRPRRALIEGLLSSARRPAIPKLGPLVRTRARNSVCGQPRPRSD